MFSFCFNFVQKYAGGNLGDSIFCSQKTVGVNLDFYTLVVFCFSVLRSKVNSIDKKLFNNIKGLVLQSYGIMCES